MEYRPCLLVTLITAQTMFLIAEAPQNTGIASWGGCLVGTAACLWYAAKSQLCVSKWHASQVLAVKKQQGKILSDHNAACVDHLRAHLPTGTDERNIWSWDDVKQVLMKKRVAFVIIGPKEMSFVGVDDLQAHKQTVVWDVDSVSKIDTGGKFPFPSEEILSGCLNMREGNEDKYFAAANQKKIHENRSFNLKTKALILQRAAVVGGLAGCCLMSFCVLNKNAQ